MSGMTGMGPIWRNLRTDRSIVDNRLDKQTVRRVFGFELGPSRCTVRVVLL